MRVSFVEKDLVRSKMLICKSRSQVLGGGKWQSRRESSVPHVYLCMTVGNEASEVYHDRGTNEWWHTVTEPRTWQGIRLPKSLVISN